MSTSEAAVSHAKSWIAAWNAHDLEAILEHYADDIEFQADTVVRRWGRVDGRLHGKDDLRRHFARGLEMVPNLRFELEEVFTGPGGYTILYRRENGNRVVEVVALDAAGRAKEARAFYAGIQP